MKILPIIAASITCLPLTVLAQPLKLDTVTVQGDWLNEPNKQQLMEHPGSRQWLGNDTIKTSGATTLGDALRLLPGINAPEHSSSSVSTLNIGVRGLSSRLTSKTTVLLDGLPLSVAPYGQPHLSLAPVNLGNIESIDVVKSGGAVRYGPQNVGGVINFESKKIPQQASASIRVKGSMSREDENQSLGEINLVTGTTNASGLGMLMTYTNQRGEGNREHSETKTDDVFVKFNQDLSNQAQLKGHVHYYESDNELPGGLTQAAYNENPYQSLRPYDQFIGQREEVTLGYEKRFNSGSLFEINGWVNTSEREFVLANKNESEGGRLDRYPRNYKVKGIEPRLSQGFSMGSGFHEVSTGYRFVDETGREQRFRRNGVTPGIDPYTIDPVLNRDNSNHTQAHAFYLDDKIDINSFTITPGVRYERITISRENNLDDSREHLSYTALLPSINSLYRLENGVNLYASYNTSFTTVTYAQINASELSDDLEPERARIYELGARQQYAQGSWEATTFAIQFDNILEYERDTGGYLNRGETFHSGVEMAMRYNLPFIDDMTLSSNYTYTKAIFKEGDVKNNEVPFYSQHVASLTADYKTEIFKLNLSLYGQSRQFSDTNNTRSDPEAIDSATSGQNGIIPGFSYVNTKLSFDNLIAHNKMSIAIGVKNVFAKDYYIRETPNTSLESGIYAGMPRTFYLETEIKL
jgi:Fe(3+) dicitrate transport protein